MLVAFAYFFFATCNAISNFARDLHAIDCMLSNSGSIGRMNPAKRELIKWTIGFWNQIEAQSMEQKHQTAWKHAISIYAEFPFFQRN